MAEIATDRVVRVGGAYYMISRALELETGEAVGIAKAGQTSTGRPERAQPPADLLARATVSSV